MESQSLRSWKNKKTISNIHLAKILSEHAKHVNITKTRLFKYIENFTTKNWQIFR